MGGFGGNSHDFGSNLSFGGGTELKNAGDSLNYYLDLSQSRLGRYKTPKGVIPFVNSKQKHLYGAIDYKFADTHTLSADYTFDDSRDRTGGAGEYYKDSSENYLFSLEPKYRGGFLTYEGEFNDKFSLFSNFGVSKRDYRILSSRPNDLPMFSSNASLNNTLYKENILQGELRGTLNLLDEALKFITGAQYKKTTLSADGLDEWGGVEKWKERETSISPFAQVEFKPVPYALFIAGIRHDRYDTAGVKTRSSNPNFRISIFPFAETDHDYTTIWASYKTPSGNERFLPKWLGGNPNLRPEKSKGYEVGLKQRFGEWGKLEASYFRTKYKDMIRLVDLGNFEWLFKNEDAATYKGIEVAAEIYPTEWLILYAAYTKGRRDDTIHRVRLYGQPDSTLKYGFIISELNGFSFSLLARQQRDFKFSNGTDYHPANKKTLIDTKAMYSWQTGSNIVIEPYLAIQNLAGTTSYTITGNPYILQSRTWQAGVNFRYNF
ncbi:MAG: TonB-dependent receptor plug domain-containing protein [Campylobacter curvus]